jgi:triosephosphate isomerase
MRKLIIGNWKMNGLASDMETIGAIASLGDRYTDVDFGLCLPATLIERAASKCPAAQIGGQDCHMESSGAYTGSVSAEMLRDAGARMVIVGHSERRSHYCESDNDVREKITSAVHANLFSIVCVGETGDQRNSGQAIDIVLQQLKGSLPDSVGERSLSIAYEPVWAIGTGVIPTIDDVKIMHAAIREHLLQRFGEIGESLPILYGGSMNGENAAALLAIANVDGGLIGGASLSVAKFEPILEAAAG